MYKLVFSLMLAGTLLTGSVAEATPVAARITMGSKTLDGSIVSRKDSLITFRQVGMSGNVSYPVDAIKEVFFPIKVDGKAIEEMLKNRQYDLLISTIETALLPYMEFSDLPSNLAQYQGVVMELYYKNGNYEKTLSYASQLSQDDRDPKLKRKSLVYQGLSLLGAERLPEAEALFAAQGWTADLPDDAPAEDLYIAAKFLAMKNEYAKALETAAKVVVFNSQDPDWMRPAELLCAEMYLKLGLVDSADEVIREISLLYKDTDEAEQAQKLKLQVDALRAKQELSGGSKDS